MTLALYGKSRRRQGGLLSLGLLAVLIAMIAGVATYGAAFAHDASVKGKATCEADGTYSIVWDIKSDNSKYMFVDSASANAGTTVLGNFSPNPVNNKGTVTGSTTGVPGTATTVTLNAQVDWWANANKTGDHFGPKSVSGAEKLKGDCAPSTVKIQVHKYLPKGTPSDAAPWENQGVGQGTYGYTLYADSSGSKGAALSGTPNPFGHLTPSVDFIPQTVWITETNTGGHNFYGWYLPEDPSSGNPKCNQAPLDFSTGNPDSKYSTAADLQVPLSYFQNTPGDQQGVYHICAYNKPGVVAATGKILVKKIGPTIPGGLASTIDFGGAVTGTNHPGTWTAKVGGVDPTNDGLADGQYTVTETTGTSSLTGGKIERVGYEELAGDATCPTPDANNYDDDGVVTVDDDTHTVCVLNKFIADPTLTKVKGSGGVTPGGLAYWDVKVDNTANTADSVDVFIKDSGATLASVVSGGSCTGTDLGAGVPCTVNAGAVLILSVTKPAPSAQCLPDKVNNSVRMWLGDEAGDNEEGDAQAGGTPDTRYDIDGVSALCGQPSITKKLVTGGTDPVTVTDPNNIAWTVVVTNPATLPGANQTVVIKDENVVVSSGPSFTGGADCDPDNATADFEDALTSASGVSCDMPGGEQLQSTITFTVKPAGEIARTCADQTFNNTASIEVGEGDPINAIGPTITLAGNEDLCPKPEVTFVKLMCGPGATIPSPIASPNPVSYDPNNLPTDCYPMAGWNFYTGTTWSPLGGEKATHTTGADGTVTHTMTPTEFDSARTTDAGTHGYFIQEEERSPFTRGTLQCYKDYGGVNDNIEQINFKDNAVSEDVTCIAYNRMPRVTVNFIKAICPTLGDVPSNQAQGGGDADRGGLLGPASPAANVKVGLANIPKDCTTVPDWQFNTGTEWNGSLGGSTASYTTVANGVPGGYAGVQHTLTGAEFMAALAGYETTGKSYFVQEVEQSPDYLFGAIKCYADHYLDDKIERVDFAKWGLPGENEQIYCIAFNVKAEREITITKRFVDLPEGFEVTKDDYPAFVFDPEPAGFDFDTDCTPSGTNPVTWTCTVPYDWDGDITEALPLPDGWQEVTCEQPDESLFSQVTGLVASITQFLERGDSFEFCNRPLATIIVKKVVTNIANDPTQFTVTLSPGAVGGQIAEAGPLNATFDELTPGSYIVTETAQNGYDTLGWALADSEGVCPAQQGTAGNQASVSDLAAGETVVVCFYNERFGNVVVDKAGPAGTIAPGTSFNWTITASVFTGSTSSDLVVTDTLPAGFTYGSLNAPSPWSCSDSDLSDRTLSCTLPGGEGTGSYTLTIPVTVPTNDFTICGPATNTVSFSGAGTSGTDSAMVDIGCTASDGQIRVRKVIIGNPAATTEFTANLTGPGIAGTATEQFSQQTVGFFLGLGAGTFTVSEQPQALFNYNGWAVGTLTTSGVSCPASPTNSGSASVTLTTISPMAAVCFYNEPVFIPLCIGPECFPPTATPTPEKPTPTPTATPTDPSDPTATPTEEPTKEPTKKPSDEPKEDIVSGEKTPGPGQTPIAPSTGTGFMGSGPGGVNMLFALVGLLAISLGTTILALGRKASRR
ncbi:MAG: DUF11 domain-containing protein [Dehalococcoidia bacterium]|nr:DUF11 domain-containing protein [Dehalococcoidia bacterium]